jgi:hypothetical protein
MRFPFTHHIERGDDEIKLEVIYSVTPFIAATYWQPAEGGEVEIISVKRDGAEFTPTDAEEVALQTACEERAHDDMAEEAAAAAEWRAQARRDDMMMERWEARA